MTAQVVVMVCRDCCCGTTGKHPRTDHDSQLRAFERAAGGHPNMQVRVVDCLDECDRSNVALIRRRGLPTRQRDTWLGNLLTPGATEAVSEWLANGAEPKLSSRVEAHAFTHVPPRLRR